MNFSTSTFCTRFVNFTSLAVDEKSHFILSAHRSVIFVSAFDAPFKLADEAIVKVPMNINFFILFERAFKIMNNGVYFIVIALLVAELFTILVYAN